MATRSNRIPLNPGFYVSAEAHRQAESLVGLPVYIRDFDSTWRTTSGELIRDLSKLPEDLWRLRLEQR